MILLRVTAPHFTAGIEVAGRAAPILAYMRGWDRERIEAYCRGKGWDCQPVPKRNLRILVTGGRDYADAAHVRAVLDRIHSERGVSEVIHGGATGADALAGQWARSRGIVEVAVPADWEKNGPSSGPIRNGAMVGMQPDGVVAFAGGRGTADCVRQAEAAGVPVWRV